MSAGNALRDAAHVLLDACRSFHSMREQDIATAAALVRDALEAHPAGDQAMPVVAHVTTVDEAHVGGKFLAMEWLPIAESVVCRKDNLVRQRDAQAAIAALDALVAGLEADLRERDERIASIRTEHGQEVSDLLVRIATLEAEGAKSERRAIEIGDIMHRHILAMRAAVVAWHRDGAIDGMRWIDNTLAGPGLIPGDSDIALGAQALFDKEVAEHEAFRAAHPGPAAPQPKEPT